MSMLNYWNGAAIPEIRSAPTDEEDYPCDESSGGASPERYHRAIASLTSRGMGNVPPPPPPPPAPAALPPSRKDSRLYFPSASSDDCFGENEICGGTHKPSPVALQKSYSAPAAENYNDDISHTNHSLERTLYSDRLGAAPMVIPQPPPPPPPLPQQRTRSAISHQRVQPPPPTNRPTTVVNNNVFLLEQDGEIETGAADSSVWVEFKSTQFTSIFERSEDNDGLSPPAQQKPRTENRSYVKKDTDETERFTEYSYDSSESLSDDDNKALPYEKVWRREFCSSRFGAIICVILLAIALGGSAGMIVAMKSKNVNSASASNIDAPTNAQNPPTNAPGTVTIGPLTPTFEDNTDTEDNTDKEDNTVTTDESEDHGGSEDIGMNPDKEVVVEEEEPPTRATETPSKSPVTVPPTFPPTRSPTKYPTKSPTPSPTTSPTESPTWPPTHSPTRSPTRSPTKSPTVSPTVSPTKENVVAPTEPIKPGQFYFSNIESGPLVGHTTQDSTSIWAFHGQGRTMQLAYRRYGDSISFTTQMPPRPNNNNAALVTVDGLEENTDYIYELSVDSTVVARGQFKTAPAFKPGKFEYLLTSCMNIDAYKGYPDQPVWDHALEKNPDFAIMAGDTIYLTEQDWTSDTREVIYDRAWYRNMRQRNEPHFAKVIGSMPTYSAWDDHEYGSNNAEKNQPGKDNSLKVFRDVWANPGYGTPEIRGNFYDYYWGDVHFIVLDNRWYRDRNTQTQLGSAQKNWLYDKLKTSKGSFKVIVNGCDIMEAGYGRDVDEIGRVVRDNNIYGVIFNAGDIHRNEFKQMTNGNWPYPVTQYTSSGIARDNWMRPWSIIKVDTERADPIITAHFYGADSEALDTTWSNDPNLRCSSIQGVNRWEEARCTETIRLSDLTPPGVQVPDTVTAPDSEEDKEPPAPHSNIDFSKTDYTVGTYYYPWYGNDNFNGRNYLRAELSPPQYPTLGEYDQRNEETITQHLKWSQQANINLWVTSWWGPDSATNRNTIAIMDSAYMEESKIKLALFYEIHGRIPDGDVSNVYGDISYAAKNYFGDPNYYKIDGKPVFYIYLARALHEMRKLDDAVNEMRRAALDNGFNIYLVGDMAHSNPPQGYYAPFDWLDAITEYDVFGSMDRPDYAGDDNRVEFYRNKQENWRQAAHSQNCDFIPSITPGYNDKGVRDAGYSSMSRKLTRNSEFGSLFQALLNNAVGQVDSAVDNAFMVTSFNEWHEDTQIEPIVGDLTNQPYSHTSGKEYEAYGTRYLDMLRDGTKRTGVSVEPQKR